MTTYKSKIGLEIVIPVTIIVGGVGILMAYEKIWIGLALVVLLIAFIVHMFLTTDYEVDNHILRIKCGFFVNTSINIRMIREIRATNNPISSPAISLDRLLILYDKYGSIIISPKDKSAFIDQLTGINPGIKVSLKEYSKHRD